MNSIRNYIIGVALMAAVPVMAQSGLTDMSNSQQAIMTNTPLGSVYNDQYAAGVRQVDGWLLGRPFQRDVNHGHLVDVGHLEHALGDH